MTDIRKLAEDEIESPWGQAAKLAQFTVEALAVLEWYRSEANYWDESQGLYPVLEDNGQRARELLEKWSKE